MPIHVLVVGCLLCLFAVPASAQSEIRQVDFKNLSYPLRDHLLGHGELKWLSLDNNAGPRLRTVHLTNGKDLKKVSSFQMEGKEYAQYSGFELQNVSFADLTGGGEEDAIVVLRYLTGGTQSTNYVYFYALEDRKPRLLAYCHTGSRAYSGLYGVFGERGFLVFELLDPARQSGNCCSSGIVRTRYRWDKNHFEQAGQPEHLLLKPQSE